MGRLGGTAVALAAAVVCAATAPACSHGARAAVTLCPLAQRHLLLDARLVVYGGNLQSYSIPSPPFSVPPGSRVFVTVTEPANLPSKSGTQVFLLDGASQPRLTADAAGNPRSNDTSVRLGSPGVWRQVALSPGRHRVYAWSDPGVQVVSCPA